MSYVKAKGLMAHIQIQLMGQSNKFLVADACGMLKVRLQAANQESDKRPKPPNADAVTDTDTKVQTRPRAADSALYVLLALLPFYFCWAPKLGSTHGATHISDFQTSKKPGILGSAMTKCASKRLVRRQTGWTDV